MSTGERAVAALGDVTDPNCWSGIPFYFWRAAARTRFAKAACRVNLSWAIWPRRYWNLRRLVTGRQLGGFQYARPFLDEVERRLPGELLAGEIISFNQHFPRAATVRAAGGRISYYIDATFASLATGRGLDLHLPEDVTAAARELERENYRLADRVVTMARWTAQSAMAECGVPQEKVFTILPGANLDLPVEWQAPTRTGRAGVDRPFVLGFLGKDWRRKGLPLVCDVRDQLERMGWKAVVRVAGTAPAELTGRRGVEFVGFIDKRDGTAAFVQFIAGCDLGCLFSTREALGISTLEFLRVGVPVAGFAIEGPADTIPADAGMRFLPTDRMADIAARLDGYLRDEAAQEQTRLAALRDSEQVTWTRCVEEMQALWAAHEPLQPFRLFQER